MRILIFHGYLLGGTGSNVYNAKLVEALSALGHEVHLLCQDRDPGRLGFVDAVGDWESGSLRVRALREPVRVTVYRPDLHGLLPVYVADRYEGLEARPFADCTPAEVGRYVAANVEAVAEVARRARPEAALANHLIMGPVIVRRALEPLGIPYAVKVHGSALEYTVKPHPERFLAAARDGLDGARTVLVGSRHTAESLWEALGEASLPGRTRLGPPGADVHEFGPREPGEARAGLADLVARLKGQAGPPAAADRGAPDAFTRDPGAAAAALARLDGDRDRLVAYVGKLIVSKGVDLLALAWPLVTAQVPEARLVVVGFGAYRSGFERLLGALGEGDLQRARALLARGRAEEGGPQAPLPMALAFLDSVSRGADADSYLHAARGMGERVVVTGRLEHSELADLLPACEAQVVPSTFPEAFGMVAVEAAACGVLPVSAEHSGLGEVSRALAPELGPPAGEWLSFPLGPTAVGDLAARLVAWLRAGEDVRAPAREALVRAVRARWSWEGVAAGVIEAAHGDPGRLADPL